jgi:hypothetical protein
MNGISQRFAEQAGLTLTREINRVAEQAAAAMMPNAARVVEQFQQMALRDLAPSVRVVEQFQQMALRDLAPSVRVVEQFQQMALRDLALPLRVMNIRLAAMMQPTIWALATLQPQTISATATLHQPTVVSLPPPVPLPEWVTWPTIGILALLVFYTAFTLVSVYNHLGEDPPSETVMQLLGVAIALTWLCPRKP